MRSSVPAPFRLGCEPRRESHSYGWITGGPRFVGAGEVSRRSPDGANHALGGAGGVREIFDIGSLDSPFPALSVVSTRRYIDANPDNVLNVLRATSGAIYLYKTRPDLTLPVVARYMRVPKDDPALLQSQETFAKHMNVMLTPSLDGIKFVLEFIAEPRSAAKPKNPADFVDARFLRKLDEEGFFKKLAAKQ